MDMAVSTNNAPKGLLAEFTLRLGTAGCTSRSWEMLNCFRLLHDLRIAPLQCLQQRQHSCIGRRLMLRLAAAVSPT